MRTPMRQAAPGVRRPSRAIPVALTAIALALAVIASAPAPAGAQGTTVAPSATLQGQRAQTQAVFEPLGRRRAVPLFGARRAAYRRAKLRAAQLARSRNALLRTASPKVAAPRIA